jgi:retron-type reverse transcriptase
MGFWDFVGRAFGRKQPASPPASAPAPPAAAETTVPVPAATTFAPISRVELAEKSEDLRRNPGWMWFGRRDLIPPATDPRTLLIDRGMVTQGFLTAEELAEMHRVGDEHMRYAHREHLIDVEAGLSGERAVEADRAARKAIKEQKKAEAAARQRLRREAVRERKANDIIFVGKGVSAQLNDRRSDLAKLTAAGLPVLHAPADLAAALGLSVPRLRWLCYHTDVATRMHYVQFDVPKKSGGTRTLSVPHATLAGAQRWILENILEKLAVESAAHGFVRGRSTLTNAAAHAGKDFVVNVDLEGFFPSIGFARVRHLFRRVGYSGAVATLAALLCTECPRKRVVYDGVVYFVAVGPRGLPQGACSSPAISNQVARRLDRRLTGLAGKLRLDYTRYADDLTLSGGAELADKVGWLLAKVRHIAQGEGFAVNESKTRLQRRNVRQTVTGLVVNVEPGVPRDIVRRVRAILHQAKTTGLEAQNRGGEPNFRAWVAGMIAYIGMARPEVGAALRRALDEVRA